MSIRNTVRRGTAVLSTVVAGAALAAATPAVAQERGACEGFRLYEVKYDWAEEYEADSYDSFWEKPWPRGTKLIGKGGARANGWVPIDYNLTAGRWEVLTEGGNDVHDFVYKTELDFIKCL